MKGKLIQALILCAVAAAAFLAIYLQKPVIKTDPPVKTEQPVVVPMTTAPINTFTVEVDPAAPIKIGIFGESRGDEKQGQTTNTVVLSQLLDAFKLHQAQAIFFTGNLFSGVEKIGISAPTPLNSERLEQKLNEFSDLYESILGSDLRFFPVLGDREDAIPGAAQEFIRHFHLKGATLVGGELAYTVSIGSAFFAVIASAEIGLSTKDVSLKESAEVLSWLENALKDAAKTHRFLFVVGHEPAFPSTSTFSTQNVDERNAFWKVLLDNHVLAYFSSREKVFDRSNRYGVWQIISGGGGAPLSQSGERHPFFHSLMLVIPPEKEGFPKLQMLDVSGKIIGEFDLKPQQEPLFQMRIS